MESRGRRKSLAKHSFPCALTRKRKKTRKATSASAHDRDLYCFCLVTSSSAAATTAAATTVAAAISAAASAVAPTASGVLSFRTRLVHVQRSSADLRSIQSGDRFFSVLVAGHLDEAEAAGSSSIAIGHNADPVDLPVRLEHLPQFVFRRVKAQVAYENILQASSSALRCRSASSMRRDWQVEETFLEIETGAGEQSNAARSIAGLSSPVG